MVWNYSTSYILSDCVFKIVHRCAGPVVNMTFRRKLGATFIFIFISFLYNIYPVITNGGSEGEGIGRCRYINSSLLICCIARTSIVFLELGLNFRLQTSITLSRSTPLL